MKKAMRKFVSVCLSLVLLLSIMPMATFASEVDANECSAPCCADDSGIMPTTLSCADGEHIYGTSVKVYSPSDEEGKHHVDILDACVVCLERRYEDPIESFDEYHQYVPTLIGTDEDIPIYRYQCKCGDKYYGP